MSGSPKGVSRRHALGIDPSTRAIGWCLLDGETVEDIGTIALASDRGMRLRQAHEAITSLLVHLEVDIAVIESYAFATPSQQTLSYLAEVGGIVRAVLEVKGTPWVEIAPSMWQSVLGFRGHKKGTKREINSYIDAVEALAGDGVVPSTPDEADAWMLVEAARRIRYDEGTLPPAREKIRQRLRDMGWPE